MDNLLDKDLDKKNIQIFNYLHLNGWLPNFSTIDKDMGYSNRYFYKFASSESKVSLKKLHTFAFEKKYKIPANLFFNEEVKKYTDIETILANYRESNNLFIENKSYESLHSFSKYKYFYVLAKENHQESKIHSWEIVTNNQKIEFKKLLNINVNLKGFIHISYTNIIIIVENLVTRSNAIFKIRLANIGGYNILPIIYLGYSTFLNAPVVGYGICSKSSLNEEEAKNILDIAHLDFSKQEDEILNRIKSEI